ncbi:MAG: OmpA family protein [Rhodobacteraceae bacterium]|nr:OmpA family protein [Paracoccaceae bacterium]
MTLRALIPGALLALLPVAAGALSLEFPAAATLAGQTIAPLSSTRIPTGPFDGTKVPVIEAEGQVTQQAWHHPRKGMTTLQILKPLREQLIADGFEVILDCAAATCGGFDFRYATDTLPEPTMHVDLGDYRFVSARRTGDGAPEYVCLMVSRSATRAYVQLTRVGPADTPAPTVFSSSKSPAPNAEIADDMPLADRLALDGRAVLGDVDFATGSASLEETGLRTLDALANYLIENPEKSVVLVGHTDTEGALESNIALSRKRAQSVRLYLVEALGVPARQVAAEGVGYLAPLASNLTEDGRMQNRRVEVIVTSQD